MPTNIWYDTAGDPTGEINKGFRRDACNALLKDTLTNKPLRDSILAGEAAARAEFEKRYKGTDPIPPEVRFICVKSDLVSRSNLVVLCLPPVEGEIPSDPHTASGVWDDCWLAAWAPY
jgi:hypothetical protein